MPSSGTGPCYPRCVPLFPKLPALVVPSAMPTERLPLPKYFQSPRGLGDVWTLQRRGVTLRCALATHSLGWELRVTVGEDFARSQVCKSEPEVFDTIDAWQAEARVKGWE